MEEIEPERWPETIRKFVDAAAGDASELIVKVSFLVTEPAVRIWNVSLGCMCCRIERTWNVVAPPPAPKKEPAEVPAVFKELFG